MHALPEILAERAVRTPERAAYVFLSAGGETSTVTYRELWRLVRAWSLEIEERTAVGARVLLLLPTGMEFVGAFLGCLAARRIAVPAYPPSPSRPSRVRAIADDARPELTVVSPGRAERVRRALRGVRAVAGSAWLDAGGLDESRADRWPGMVADLGLPAFLQYTSGSTATPRGVCVTHANVLHNAEQIRIANRLSPETTTVSWLPLFHDMGLVGMMIAPLYVGGASVLMSTNTFLQKPARWLQAVSAYRAYFSGGPNSAYDLCVRRVTPEESVGLDLSCWQVAFNGAEPVRATTLEAFAARFRESGFRSEAFSPCYGLAEATLMVSMCDAPRVRYGRTASLEQGLYEDARPGEDAKALVSCGPPYASTVRIVDPGTRRPASEAAIGEIWLSGVSVAAGYWDKEEATADAFGARLEDTHEGPFLRTGDLGLFLDGELFVTGRLKDVIVLNGTNHYPQDIELTVGLSHPSLVPGGGAAFAADVDGTGNEELVIVQELRRRALRGLDARAIGDAARAAVRCNHGLELAVIVLTRPGGVPRTSSGKLQRGECRRALLDGTLRGVAESRAGNTRRTPMATVSRAVDDEPDAHPSSARAGGGGRDIARRAMRDVLVGSGFPERRRALLAHMQEEVAAILGLAPRQSVDSSAGFFDLGMSSVSAVEFRDRLSRSLDRDLEPTLIFDYPTLDTLADRLAGEFGRNESMPPRAAEPKPEDSLATHGGSVDDERERYR